VDGFAADVKLAWKNDSLRPSLYPFGTADVFWDTFSELQGKKLVQKKKTGRLPPPSPPAKRFADLFNEETIRAVYNDNHTDSVSDT
jgi:hypothetical protein